jgi:hypothetical protein
MFEEAIIKAFGDNPKLETKEESKNEEKSKWRT